ncbi:hypothetical protein [Ochrobactrum quorumnocens]|uniref:Uncharacterized protein n=1 Tax=Ochrobactrum quorumnocens TaxID=271865 RepID=A0A5N1K4Q4_9HYPH|nr:hypothetical protein [[Ochrobactrum] quorumnocens]KAA9369581.1 hypothetical protein F3W84_05440 [[Ochrobactrum] quorumnocens]
MDLPSYQKRVQDWIEACFPADTARNSRERSHRFLEEALELCQSLDVSRNEVYALVDYVYSRPKGDAHLEAGAALLTLAALSNAKGIDLATAGESELARNWDRIDLIRAKFQTKPKGSALPQ